MEAWLDFRIFSRWSIFFVGVIAGPVNASMYVYPMETSLGENGAPQIRVISKDNDVQFVMVKLKKIVNPGTNKENEIESDMSDAGQLIVTPQKIALAAGGERAVRLVSMNLPKKETTWRVYFEGVNEAAYNFTSGRVVNALGDAQVGVNIIWGVLVHVAPQKAVTSMEYNHASGKVINTGTIRIPVRELGTCRSASDCTWEKKELTIYPDSELAIPGVTLKPGNLYKIKYFNWIKNSEEVMELHPL